MGGGVGGGGGGGGVCGGGGGGGGGGEFSEQCQFNLGELYVMQIYIGCIKI